ncbi:hypothetical protein [Chryseobacterium sp. IT-36CA2]|uniref:hypothetical protein n=1 Tax=Chryseobacterium sp. IT-36CA2 TaxID=3026460 RepID=UPI0039E109A1
MKDILVIAILAFSAVTSCQKKPDNLVNIPIQKNLNEFLKITLSEGENIFIGKLNTINNSPREDFEIKNIKDSIFVYKNFLESDNFDGKKIVIEKSNSSIKKIDLIYKISLFFNGTEKANKFIPLNFNIPFTIDKNSTIPLFSKLKNNKELQNFIAKNNSKIKEKAYEYYINYYSNISNEELKTCCITDFNNYNKLKNINKNSIASLDIEKDLGMYIDYESIVINLIGSKKNKPIIFTKKIDSNTDDSQSIKNTEVTTSNNDWKGSYKISTKAISQYDNNETNILYSITVESNQKAVLSIGAENVEDYWCEGEYHLIKEGNILHAKGKCDQDDIDDFYLKNENKKYFIKSKRFINKDWQELEKE